MKKTITFLSMLAGFLMMVTGLSAQVTVVKTYDTAGANSFVVPQGVSQITIQTWSGGGAGGSADGIGTGVGASGGGGGAYVGVVLNVTPGQTYTLNVANAVGGGAGDGSDGENSSVLLGTTNILTSFGGKGGFFTDGVSVTSPAGGLGGTGIVPLNANIVSSIITNGQNGGAGATGPGVSSGAGGNAANLVDGGGTGGDAVTGSTSPGNTGDPAGGAGSGGLASGLGTSANGGGGSRGLIIITYECPDLLVSCPTDEIIAACEDQTDVDDAYQAWLDSFAAGVSGGCNTSYSFTTLPAAPSFCGGTVTVVFSVTSDEEDFICTRTFTVTDAPEITYTSPMNEEPVIGVCTTEVNVNAAFDAWIAAIEGAFDGACDRVVSNDWDGVYPNRCGDVVTVTFEATDLSGCVDPVSVTLTFTVVEDQPAVFVYLDAGEFMIGPWLDDPSNPEYPGDQTVPLPSDDVCAVLVDWTSPWVFDECVSPWGTPSINIVPHVPVTRTVVTTSGMFSPGVYSVTYSFTDICSNITSHTFTITVTDPFPPSLTGGTVGPLVVDADEDCEAVVSWTNPVVDDNCPNLDKSLDIYFPDGSSVNVPITTVSYTFPLGTSSVTFTASDNDNTTTHTFLVIVEDNDPPTFTCPVADGTTYYVDNDLNVCHATLDFTVTDADDNCGVSTITYYVEGVPEVIGTLAAGTLTATFIYDFPVGPSTVLIEVWDVNGNDATCSFDVEVTDIEPPLVYTQSHTLELGGTGEATLDVWDVFDSAWDNCDVVTSTLSVSPSFFTCDNLGPNVVTVTIEDVNGLVGYATAQVTVVDLLPPTILCFNTDRFYDANPEGACSWTVPLAGAFPATWGLLPASPPVDNCGVETLTYSLSGASTGTGEDIRGQVFNVGVTTVTWTAIDASGNDASCSFLVTITDAQAPTLSCVEDIDRDTDPGLCSYEVQGTEFDAFDVDDNCAVITLSWELSGDTSDTGLNTLDGVIFEKGVTTVTWTAIDAALNETSCSFTVTVEDNEKPAITCPAPIELEASSGSCTKEHTWLRPLATDNCPGTIKYTITSDANPPISFQTTTNPDLTAPNNIQNTATFPVGITMVTYTVEDANGNINSCTFSVTVDAYSPVVAKAEDIIVQLDEFGVVTITAADIDDGSIVPCLDGDPIDPYLSLSQYVFNCSHVGVVNVVTLTVTDKSGRIDTATATVTVEDVTPPVVYAESVVDIYVDEFGTATLTVADVYINATDACGINTSTWYVEPSSFTCADIGAPITYTLWVQDANENWGYAEGLVNVYDDLAPVMACTITGTLTVGTATNTCNYTHADSSWDLSATDNCGAVTVTYSLDGATVDAEIVAPNTTLAGQVFNLGITTVTWTAVDAYNNLASCTFYVEVIDDVFPTIACVTDTFRYNDTGECIYTVQGDEFDPDYGDNCSATIEHDYALAPVSSTLAGAEFPIGTTDVVWTVTDGAGNPVSCTITIQIDDQDAPVWDYVWNVPNSLTCGDNMNLPTGVTPCAAFFTWSRPGNDDYDDCSTVVVTESISNSTVEQAIIGLYGVYNQASPNSPAAILPVGVTTFTYTATDSYGMVSVCYFTVTVDDGQDPVIATCPEDRNIEGCSVADIDYPEFSEVMTLSSYSVFSGVDNGGNASDNCGIAEVWYMDEIIEISCPIVVERTWYVVDYNGRSTSCVQTIRVNEEEAPTLIDPNSLIALGGDQGNVCLSAMPAYPAAVDIAALFEDNCTVTPTASYDGPLYGLDNSDCSWIVTYTYTVFDDCLNDAYAEVVYWGGDSEAPSLVSSTLSCHDVLSIETLTWCLSEAEEFDPTTLESAVAALYKDNCTTPTAQWVGTESGTFNTNCSWEFVYTFEITDGCNTVTCTVTYAGSDEEAPVLVSALPGGDVGNVCYGDRPAAPDPAVIADAYTDNCGTVTATLIDTEVSGNSCGWTVTYTYTVDDGCENFAPNAVVVFTGADTEGPVVANAAELQWVYECADAIPRALDLELHADFTDNCGGPFGVALVSVVVDLQEDCAQARTITRTYTITDYCGNPTTFVQRIEIQDNTPPSLKDPLATCEDLHMTGENSLDLCYAEAALIDTDAIAAAVADLYEDECGTVTATLFDSDLTGGNCGWTATYTFEITDGCSSTFCVVVYEGRDMTPPSGAEPLAIVDRDVCAVDAPTEYPFDAAYAVAGYTDNCGEPVTVTLTNTTSDGNDCGWIITYTFSVWDKCDNELPGQVYTVSGRDQTDPEGTMPSAITGVDACISEVGVTVALFDAAYAVFSYTDNCGGTVTATNESSSAVSGTDCGWIVTWTFDVEDVCGNALPNQYYTISGYDQTDPEIFDCPEGVIQVTVSAGCDYEADDKWDVTATDNCTETPTLTYTLTGDTDSGGPVTASTLEGVMFEIGTTVVTWTATDACGNYVTCTFTVQVTEGAPSFVEPLVENQEVDVDDSSSCTYTHSGDDWDPELYPSCVTLTLTWELIGATTDSGSNTLDDVEFNVGVTTVTWTASDGISSSKHVYTVTVRPVSLIGFVRYYKYNATDVPIQGAIVRLMNGNTPVPNGSATTLANGSYVINDKAAVQAADGIQVFVGLPHGGLSSGDAYAIRLRVNNTYPNFWGPTGTPDYRKFIDRVATVRMQNGTSPQTIDALQVFQRHTGNLAAFNSGDWAFMSEHDNVLFDYVAIDTGYRTFDQDFCTMNIAVRPHGDVRGTYPFALPAPTKSLNSIQSDEVTHVVIGENFELPVTVNQVLAINAASMYLGYDMNKLEIVGVKSNLPEFEFMIQDGTVRIEWYDLNTMHFNAGDAFVTLIARTLTDVSANDLVFTLDQGTEFIDFHVQVIPDVELSVNSISTSDATVGITDPDQLGISLEAFPNPFRDELTLNYHIDEPGMVKMTLVNMLGATIANLVDYNHDNGSYTYQLNPGSLSLEYGVYFVRMEVQGESRLYNTHVKLIYMK